MNGESLVDFELKTRSIFFSVMAILFLWTGPVTECPPSVLAPPIPPWGTPSAAGVAEEHPVPPIPFIKGNCHNHGKKDAYLKTEILDRVYKISHIDALTIHHTSHRGIEIKKKELKNGKTCILPHRVVLHRS